MALTQQIDTSHTTTSDATWGIFDSYRDTLYNQFRQIDWLDAPDALPPDALEQAARALLAELDQAPRVLQKARIFELIATRAQINLEPWDWFPSKLNHGHLLQRIRGEWWSQVTDGPLQAEDGWFAQAYALGICKATLDVGHISPGWEHMFAAGLNGLVAQVDQARQNVGDAAMPEQRAFWQAVEIVYGATMTLYERFARRADDLAQQHPEHAQRMRAVAAACRQVPAGAPQTFHQSLLFAFLMHELIEMEGEMVRSMGHFDRVWHPYYRADIDAGRLTPSQAQELIQHLWMKFHARTRGKQNGKNFLSGGQDAEGNPIESELTYLALDAYEALKTPDPKLSVRFVPGTSQRLYRRVADLIRRGYNSFVLMNDAPAVEALVQRGKPLADARTYLPIGCYEPAVDGKETGCTMNLTMNLAKGVEYALHDGLDLLSGEQIGLHTGDPRTKTFEELVQATLAQIDHLLGRTMQAIRAHEDYWPAINPSPLIAGTLDDCIARGKDIGQGGARYNSTGCVAMALANTADALYAVKRTIYDEGSLTWDELLAALKDGFEGHEPLRLYLTRRLPKWGNGDAEVDALAKRIADFWCARAHAQHNRRGGGGQAALFSLDYQWRLGRNTAALPDGHKPGMSLAPGVGATAGSDHNGLTGQINSATRLDYTQTPNGAVLDLTLHPTAVSGEDGLNAMVEVIKSFFARGGYAVQFNVFDVNTLRKAQKHPEQYATLQIRVTGWSVFFTQLTRYEQDQFILRNAQGL